MNIHRFLPEQIKQFTPWLREEERSTGTMEKYTRDVGAFAAWLGARPVTRETVIGWKEHLLAEGYCPTTVASSDRSYRFCSR